MLLDPAEDSQRLVWPVKDHGAPAFHSYLLVAREQWASAHPGPLAALLAGAEQGFRAAAADPAATARHFEHVAPYFPARVLRASAELIAPTWFDQGTWGQVRPELLAPYAQWLAERGALPDLSGLPGAFDPRPLDHARTLGDEQVA